MNVPAYSEIFPNTPLDPVIANDRSAYGALGDLGEAFVANLLRAELATLKQAHQEGEEAFHTTLQNSLQAVANNRPEIAPDASGTDFINALARSCVVLAYGANHRMFRHMMSAVRGRVGRHLLARPGLLKGVMGVDPTFARTFEKALGSFHNASNRPPMELLKPQQMTAKGAADAECSFCSRYWSSKMPQCQIMPMEYEQLDNWDPTASGRDAVIELGGAFYRLALEGDTPLRMVCCHDHVIDQLLAGSVGVFDPWINELAVGFLPPEDGSPLLAGWKRY